MPRTHYCTETRTTPRTQKQQQEPTTSTNSISSISSISTTSTSTSSSSTFSSVRITATFPHMTRRAAQVRRQISLSISDLLSDSRVNNQQEQNAETTDDDDESEMHQDEKQLIGMNLYQSLALRCHTIPDCILILKNDNVPLDKECQLVSEFAEISEVDSPHFFIDVFLVPSPFVMPSSLPSALFRSSFSSLSFRNFYQTKTIKANSDDSSNQQLQQEQNSQNNLSFFCCAAAFSCLNRLCFVECVIDSILQTESLLRARLVEYRAGIPENFIVTLRDGDGGETLEYFANISHNFDSDEAIYSILDLDFSQSAMEPVRAFLMYDLKLGVDRLKNQLVEAERIFRGLL